MDAPVKKRTSKATVPAQPRIKHVAKALLQPPPLADATPTPEPPQTQMVKPRTKRVPKALLEPKPLSPPEADAAPTSEPIDVLVPAEVVEPKAKTKRTKKESAPSEAKEGGETSSGCQAIIGSGDMAGKCCGCKVKAPSTDRCGRHINAKVKEEAKVPDASTETKAPRKRVTGKSSQNKEAQRRQAVARHNVQWQTTLLVNAYGHAVYPGTNIVIDPTKDAAVGVQEKDGVIRPMRADELLFCAQKFIPYCALPVLINDEKQAVVVNDDEVKVVVGDDEVKVVVVAADPVNLLSREVVEVGLDGEDEDEEESDTEDEDDVVVEEDQEAEVEE